MQSFKQDICFSFSSVVPVLVFWLTFRLVAGKKLAGSIFAALLKAKTLPG